MAHLIFGHAIHICFKCIDSAIKSQNLPQKILDSANFCNFAESSAYFVALLHTPRY
ncbi:hypothetical protein ACWIUD_02740 [Helicobacter sp. 23-1044]